MIRELVEKYGNPPDWDTAKEWIRAAMEEHGGEHGEDKMHVEWKDIIRGFEEAFSSGALGFDNFGNWLTERLSELPGAEEHQEEIEQVIAYLSTAPNADTAMEWLQKLMTEQEEAGHRGDGEGEGKDDLPNIDWGMIMSLALENYGPTSEDGSATSFDAQQASQWIAEKL